MTSSLDAVVIGSGPNGLSAAITFARAGHSVRVFEAASTIGGGMRSEALTETGCVHDVCAAVFSMMLASPFLKTLPLAEHGLEFVHPDAPLAHPLDDGTAIIVEQSIERTAASLDAADKRAYCELMVPMVAHADALMESLLAPISLRRPLLMASFGMKAIQSAVSLAKRKFKGPRGRAMFAGVAAHSLVPLEFAATAGYGFGLLLGAHGVGWPIVRGGSQHAANAMASYLKSLGGEIVTGQRIASLDQMPTSRVVLCDVTPRQWLAIAGERVPASYRRRLEKFRYGPGVFKIDWTLNAPVPWRAKECARAGTLHLGGSMEEIAASERAPWNGSVSDRPYVLVVQPSLFDPTRAPSGKHTLWAYCHVPNGYTADMTSAIEGQIERFAPGFRECISSRHVLGPPAMEQHNANYIGGDIAGGAADLMQIFARPVASFNPYRTPLDGVYLCSSSTPPGVGVHGMCGYWAARTALRRLSSSRR